MSGLNSSLRNSKSCQCLRLENFRDPNQPGNRASPSYVNNSELALRVDLSLYDGEPLYLITTTKTTTK